MIQDIYPSKLDCVFTDYEMKECDAALFFDEEGRILIGEEEEGIRFTTGADAGDRKTVYLFSLDEKKFFLVIGETGYEKEGFVYHTVREIRDMYSGKEVFAVFTAYHLWKWYADNIFCGRCAEKLSFDGKERALRCPKCGNVIYPRINPAVIVGVTKGDSLLITRYNRGYAHNALVAGFTEIGETLEENQGGKTEEVVSGQVLEGLKGMSAEDAAKIIVAYEPVWAIGTGLAATGPDANKVIADYIRKPYASMYGEEAAQAIRVLYGGSVKGNNAAEFFGQPDIDGALVGGASLKAPDFTDIVKAAAA